MVADILANSGDLSKCHKALKNTLNNADKSFIMKF
jgi:hypothetical protein